MKNGSLHGKEFIRAFGGNLVLEEKLDDYGWAGSYTQKTFTAYLKTVTENMALDLRCNSRSLNDLP